MKERLQKILSARGVASRRKAEEMLRQGQVSVNGTVAQLGDSADPDADEIRINGQLLPKQEQYIYLMLYKPRGYVTTLSDEDIITLELENGTTKKLSLSTALRSNSLKLR